jgi:hypothetical protein
MSGLARRLDRVAKGSAATSFRIPFNLNLTFLFFFLARGVQSLRLIR